MQTVGRADGRTGQSLTTQERSAPHDPRSHDPLCSQRPALLGAETAGLRVPRACRPHLTAAGCETLTQPPGPQHDRPWADGTQSAEPQGEDQAQAGARGRGTQPCPGGRPTAAASPWPGGAASLAPSREAGLLPGAGSGLGTQGSGWRRGCCRQERALVPGGQLASGRPSSVLRKNED